MKITMNGTGVIIRKPSILGKSPLGGFIVGSKIEFLIPTSTNEKHKQRYNLIAYDEKAEQLLKAKAGELATITGFLKYENRTNASLSFCGELFVKIEGLKDAGIAALKKVKL